MVDRFVKKTVVSIVVMSALYLIATAMIYLTGLAHEQDQKKQSQEKKDHGSEAEAERPDPKQAY